MATTRERVLEILDRRGAATALEVANGLKTTAANARHHLSILEKEGVVQAIQTGSSGKRGRPSQLYRRTNAVSANAYDMLASSLLTLSLKQIAGDDPSLLDDFIDRLTEIVFQRMSERIQPANRLNLTNRLQTGVQELSKLHYNPRWEARLKGPRVILGHCPFAAIVADYPQLCVFDRHLIQRIINQPVELISKLEPAGPGLRQCVFAVK